MTEKLSMNHEHVDRYGRSYESVASRLGGVAKRFDPDGYIDPDNFNAWNDLFALPKSSGLSALASLMAVVVPNHEFGETYNQVRWASRSRLHRLEAALGYNGKILRDAAKEFKTKDEDTALQLLKTFS